MHTLPSLANFKAGRRWDFRVSDGYRVVTATRLGAFGQTDAGREVVAGDPTLITIGGESRDGTTCPRCGAPVGPGRCYRSTGVPNPGSPEAATLGCSCPGMENRHGRGMPLPPDDELDPGELITFWINPPCLLHGDWLP